MHKISYNTEMGNIEYKKAAINYLQNEMTYYWNTAFIVGGGSLSLSMLNNFSLKWLFFLFGIFFTVFLFRGYFCRRIELLKIINNLREAKV
jgi:lysylphosphatidylglycerol synthetase-like protein (DUF2156 family)